MDMGVFDGLPSSQSVIDTDVEPLRTMSLFNQRSDLGYKLPNRRLIPGVQFIEGADMLLRDDEGVTDRNGKRVADGHSGRTLEQNALGRERTKWTRQLLYRVNLNRI
jgi:hypothetical protein